MAAASAVDSTAAAGISVDTISFCRLECDHSDLFQLEYKRSNRTKGLKILRCFPHCCPNHIDRSYCGSSLHVIVQATGSASRSRLADNVFLFARFECSADQGLQVGDSLLSSVVSRDAQSEENPEGTWIPGVKERASVLSSAMKSVTQAINDQTLVYQLNGKVYSRWYYDWESGANKAQRLMRHVLKAYVFERVLSEDKQAPSTLRVIGVVSSPEFTVISYRRAPNEAGGTGAKADATPREPSPSGAGGSNNSSNRASPELDRPDAHKRPHYDGGHHRLSVSSLDSDPKRRRHSELPMGWSHASSRPPLALRDASPQQVFEDQVLWEHAHAPIVTISKNLALVYCFLKWTPLDYYASFIDELMHMMNHQVLEPLVTGDKRLEKLNFFARVLLHQAPTLRQRVGAPPAASRSLESLLRTMAQVVTWFFVPETRRWVRELVDRFAWTLPHKSHLRGAFVGALVQLEARLNEHVFAKSPLQSLANTAEEIIAAVYTHELYHPKRPVVRQILGEHGFLGWRPFVAQMRDAFIEFSALQRPPRTPFRASHPLEHAWNGEWMLDMDESTWKPYDESRTEGFSLLSLLDVITQLTRVFVTLRVDQRVLSVASRAALSTAARDGLKLVLDGKSRVSRFSPHGLSTAMSEGADGDYIGSTRFEGPDRLVAYVETFRWARLPDTRSYHVRLRLTHTHEKDQPRLWVNGEVLETISTASFSSEELQYMPELKIAAKMKAVARGAARQPPPAAAPDGARINPGWRRLGGVRLTYCRARR